MGGEIRSDLLEMVCPECFKLSVTGYSVGEEIKNVCSECGVEVDESYSDIDSFSQDLDRDVTYAPTSQISWTKGLGCTLDQKKELHKLLNDSSVRVEDFQATFPEIATAFKDGTEFVHSENGFVYRQMSDYVRKVPVSDVYAALDSLFHAFDVPLRKKKAMLASGVSSDLKRALEYGFQLCTRYGFDNKDRDQPVYNTVGNEIRLMKHQLKAQKRNVPEKRMVETIFYICLLKFDKHGVAAIVKSELDVDLGLVNYYDSYKEFLRLHDHVDGSPILLSALEQACSQRFADK
jgi:hypothetical protein